MSATTTSSARAPKGASSRARRPATSSPSPASPRRRRRATVPNAPRCRRIPPPGRRRRSTRDNCLGQECPNAKECFVTAARREAQAADVVVVNHHLFFADVMLRDTGIAELLPACNTVIFDEAHQLPETASLFFGENVSTSQLLDLARDARMEGLAAAQDFAELPDGRAHAGEGGARPAPGHPRRERALFPVAAGAGLPRGGRHGGGGTGALRRAAGDRRPSAPRAWSTAGAARRNWP